MRQLPRKRSPPGRLGVSSTAALVLLAAAVSSAPGAAPSPAQDRAAGESMPAAVKEAMEALGEAWRWRLFDRREGLTSSSISALHSDPDNFIYAATDLGLNRYDLWEWSAIENGEPFQNGEVVRFGESLRVIYAATPRALWRLHTGPLLSLVYQGDGLHLAANLGESFLIDEGKRKHLRIRGESLTPVDGAEAEVSLPPGSILDYAVDINRNHWLATTTALFTRSLDRRRWREVEERELDPALTGLRCARFFVLAGRQDSAGRPEAATPGEPPGPAAGGELWALYEEPRGAPGGGKLARLENGSWVVVCGRLDDFPVRQLLRDAAGLYHGMTEDGRLFLAADGCRWFEVKSLGLGKVALHGGLLDPGGFLWFRVGSGGVAAFDGVTRRWERIPSAAGQTFPNVLSLLETESGDIWMGLKEGLSRWHAAGGLQTFTRVQETPLQKVTGLAEDNRQRLWVSSAESFNGAFNFDGTNWGSESVPGFSDHPVRRIVRDRRGDLWFLSQERLARGASIVYRLSVATRYVLAGVRVDRGPVNDLVLTEDGVFWIATEEGLLRAAEKEGRFDVDRVFTEADGLRSRSVFSVAEGPDGAIWVCYPYSGVSRLHGGSVRHYGEAEGLASSAVWSVALAGQSLWFGTDLGLSRFDGECWYNLPVAAARPERSNVRALQPSRRERDAVLVGTFGQGALRFRGQPRGRPRFTRRRFPARALPGAALSFEWEARDFRDETPGEAILCRWRLDGKQWSPFSAARSCVLADVPEGSHTFELEARDLDGNRNRDEEVHRFEVGQRLAAPGRWLWPAAGAAGGLAVLGGALGIAARRAGRRRRLLRYRRLFEAFPGPVFIIDRRGVLLDYNGAAPELAGLENVRREDILERPLRLAPLFASDNLRSCLERLQAGEPFRTVEERRRLGEGGERQVAVSGFPTHRAGGRVDGAVVMVEDRTGERIEERERRLRSLRDLAARVGGELRDFLRDLKETAPAAALDGAPEGRWLERRLRHLDDVASGLAAFSGRGVEAAAGVKTGAEEVLEGVLAAPGNGVFLPEGTAARSKIRIDYRLGPGLWPVAMGERALADAITEVLRNACEAMPDGGSLTVRAANLRLEETGGALPPGAYVEVQVKDTGGGIDPSQIERVLEPFYSTKPRDRSLGVGLSLAYGAVRAAGGDLRLESQPGKGTTVRILLPAAR